VVVVDWANRLKEIESRKNSFVSTEDHQNYWLEFEAKSNCLNAEVFRCMESPSMKKIVFLLSI